MKRQPRLGGIEIALQVTDTSFTALQQFQNGQTRFVRQCMEETRGSAEV